jgi:hypothetical protein
MLTSVRLAEHESEGNNEELIASVVTDMQNPVTPIIEAALAGEGFHDARRMPAPQRDRPLRRRNSRRKLSSYWSNGNRPGSCSASFSGTTGLASRCIFGSWDLQPVRTTHLPSLQDNMSCAGGTLLGFSQWEGEKEGRPFGGTRRMNAATQTAGQLADDR